MYVVLVVKAGIKTEGRCVAAQIAYGSLGAFLHDIAKGACEQDLALAFHHSRLDGQDLAACPCPGKAVGHAGEKGVLELLVQEDGRPEQLLQILSADREGRLFAFGLLAGKLAAHSPNLALEFAHACLAGVVQDDAFEGV